MKNEIWKDVINYEGLYQVSNFGGVKSLKRKVRNSETTFRTVQPRIVKPSNNGKGYLIVDIGKNSKRYKMTVHKLVAMAFLDHDPKESKLIIDHIDNDKSNNNLSNLQLITYRENNSKDIKGGTSKFIGVHWVTAKNRWRADIQIEGKKIYLGLFKCELLASKAYQDKLKTIIK